MRYLDARHDATHLETTLGFPGTVVRNWRTRGFLSGIGTIGPNGRWTYSDSDLLKIACAQVFLEDGATNVSQAIILASVIEIDVLLQLFPSMKRPLFFMPGRWIAVSVEPDGSRQRIPADDLSEFKVGTRSLLSLIDIDLVSRKLPTEFSGGLTVLSKQEVELLYTTLANEHAPVCEPAFEGTPRGT
jgi:hypothetical protein